MLRPKPRAASQLATPVAGRTDGETRFEIRHESGVQAVAVEEDGEFIVLEGSEALMKTGYVQQSDKSPKAHLLATGTLIPDGPDRLRFGMHGRSAVRQRRRSLFWIATAMAGSNGG